MTGSAGGSYALLAVLTVMWGGNWPAIKVAVREIDPWIFRTICLVVGGSGLLALVRSGGASLRVPRGERGPLAVAAFFNITVWHLCSAYGLTLIEAGRGAIIAYTMPLWTVIFGRLLYGERIGRARLLALALGLAGLVVLVAPSAGALRAAPGGTLLMLGAASGWGVGTVLTKARRWTIPTAALTGWQVLIGAIPIVLGAAVRMAGTGDAAPRASGVSHVALLGTAYSALVGVIFCHWAWFRLVAVLPGAVAAIGILGVPIVGLFASALLLDEPLGPSEILALVLVVASLGILVRSLGTPVRESTPGPGPVSTVRRDSP